MDKDLQKLVQELEAVEAAAEDVLTDKQQVGLLKDAYLFDTYDECK